jgi:hypothetical protein
MTPMSVPRARSFRGNGTTTRVRGHCDRRDHRISDDRVLRPPGSEGAVNHDSGEGWTIKDDTLEQNAPGAAMMVGTNNVITDNCVTDNGEYGFNAFSQ